MRFIAVKVLMLVLSFVLSGCGGAGREDYPAPPAATRAEAAVAAARPVDVVYPSFGDFKPHPWDGRAPQAYPVHGIDVSRWQGTIDWPTVRAAGISFALIKATEGGDHTDPAFPENWQGAAHAGIPRGAYHFYYFCRPAVEQARWFIQHVPRDRAALPAVLDLEWNHKSRNCPFDSRPYPATVRAEAKRFLDILTAHYGQRPVIYTTVDFYHETGIGALPGTEFWLRSVAGHPSTVYPGQRWTFWQYTGTGMVPGIRGPVDINVFAGSARDWTRWRN